MSQGLPLQFMGVLSTSAYYPPDVNRVYSTVCTKVLLRASLCASGGCSLLIAYRFVLWAPAVISPLCCRIRRLGLTVNL